MTADLQCELQNLVQFIQTGLASPTLQKSFQQFPEAQLRFALRDILDWLSLRSILRTHHRAASGRIHPLAGRVLSALPRLRAYLWVADGRLSYRVEIQPELQQELEDRVKELIWQSPPPMRTRRITSTRTPSLIA